jgi:hypothetical protein
LRSSLSCRGSSSSIGAECCRSSVTPSNARRNKE